MLFLPILIGMIAVAGGVIFFVSQMFHGIGSITTNPGGFTTAFPTLHSTLRPSSPGSVEPTVDASPAIPPPGSSQSIAGIGDNKTVACNDSTVSVSGSQNTITITGHCTSLTVSGIDNNVTVDSAEEITVSGFDNHVVFKSGSPEVQNNGQNVVEQG